ncbi:alcohol dehydrogenase [Purpureocillium lavendulum]|uniref:Alcohol dehydrogenase n=1 Tax=Purpureocillium lavendulum TaxID=1247861 RepID=A0AB34FR40_9HYPO|nr:alcohol dehydrogenase [Purpureocillium lavendulum]
MASRTTNGSAHTLVALDVGLGRPMAGKSSKEVFAGGAILAVTPDGGQVKTILEDAKFVALPDGVVYNDNDGRLYWTNMGVPPQNDGSVCSAALDGSDPRIVIPKGKVHTPKQLAVDKENGKLYISDREGLRVIRCNLDGSDFETIVLNGDLNNDSERLDATKWCVGMTLSKKYGVFYWTQKGPPKSGKGAIYCAPMAGSGKRKPICIIDDLPEPIDVDIDEDTNTLFWTDRGEIPYGNTLNKLALSASGTSPATKELDSVTGLRYSIVAQHFDEAIGLVYDRDTRQWFVGDMGGNIWRHDVGASGKTKVLEEQNRAFTGITLVRKAL